MFKLFRQTAEVEDEKKQEVDVTSQLFPFPVAQVPVQSVDEGKRRSYEALAKKLKFDPTELTRIQLLEFFREHGISLYDYNQVEKWLTRKKDDVKAEHWCWRPLRAKDAITEYFWGRNEETLSFGDGYYHSKLWECRPYDRLIPEQILIVVASIEAGFGRRVRFFVSDYASPSVDPFIMVRPAKSDSGDDGEYHLIFGVWNEPGF